MIFPLSEKPSEEGGSSSFTFCYTYHCGRLIKKQLNNFLGLDTRYYSDNRNFYNCKKTESPEGQCKALQIGLGSLERWTADRGA